MNFLLANHLIGFSLISIVLPLIAALVYLNRPGNTLNRTFSIYLVAIAWWSFFTIFMIYSHSQKWGYFWDRVCLTGVVFIPSTLFHFMSAYTNETKRLKIIIWLNYFFSLFFLLGLWLTKWFVADVRPKFGLNYFTVPGKLYLPFVLFFIFTVVFSLILLKKYAKNSPSKKIRTQAHLLFWFSIIGYTGGCGNYLLVYDINLPGVAETSNYGVLILSVSIAYIIFRYNFLDIEVIIKRTLVFAGLFSVMTAVVAGMTALTQSFVGQLLHLRYRVSMAVSVAIAIFLYEPLKKLLVNATDKYLFQKKEDIKVILNRLSENIVTILDIEKVGKTILSTLQDSLRLESGAIIIKDENESRYKALDAFGISGRDLQFQRDDEFIQRLPGPGKIMNLEDPAQMELLPHRIQARMQDLKAAICLPLYLSGDLVGLMTLGKKKSDEEFTKDELDYFPTVQSQAAIALSYARAIDILKKSQIDFAQQAKMAAVGTLSAGIGHEIKNPLNNIMGAIGMLKINRKHRLHDNKTKEEMETEIFEVLQVIEENVKRANDVMERLSGFAKKPKELKIEPVNLEKAIEGALAFLGRNFETDNIAVRRNYSPRLPNVLADQHALEDVFMNLLVNARHAIKDKGMITVVTSCHDGEVEASIQDTGAGIAPENLEKIFDPFFTTKDTTRNQDTNTVKGTGLGLFIVRETIKRLGGRIATESKLGGGTTFRIYFPIPIKGNL